jgi:hypothetical protein
MESDTFYETYFKEVDLRDEPSKLFTSKGFTISNDRITQQIERYKNETFIQTIKDRLLEAVRLNKKNKNVVVGISLDAFTHKQTIPSCICSSIDIPYMIVQHKGKYIKLYPVMYPLIGQKNPYDRTNKPTIEYFTNYNEDTQMLKKYIEETIKGSSVRISVIDFTIVYTISMER